MNTAGYSGTPLAKKLGLKKGFLISVIGAPEGYFDLFDDMPAGVNNVPLEKGKHMKTAPVPGTIQHGIVGKVLKYVSSNAGTSTTIVPQIYHQALRLIELR